MQNLAIQQLIMENGIGIISSHAHVINDKVAIEIQLQPDTNPVLVLGVVKWVRKIEESKQYRIGLNFLEVLAGSEIRFKKYLNTI